ncbi:BrnA antitoxin family protein [Frigidibacter sp. MR17.14]|uniref:BrnA antitoxin family protein n=1 Tax=Frigidibacter sp. MR17.14 TaxID=3126509 RepID=UPI0030131698
MTEPRQNAKTRENYHYMADAMRRLEWDLHNAIVVSGQVPVAWHRIAQERVPKRKERVTLRLDEDVLRFMRSMGANYGPRINEVLRVWMHARLAGVVRDAATIDYRQRRVEEGFDGPRPGWGDSEGVLEAEARRLGLDLGEIG